MTAEEKGLLGAKHYAEHPLYPLAKTLADINMDVINLWGRTRDVVSVGYVFTTLDDLLAGVAKEQGRTVAERDVRCGCREIARRLFFSLRRRRRWWRRRRWRGWRRGWRR